MDLPMIEAMQTPALFACPENDSQMDAKFRGEVEEVRCNPVTFLDAALLPLRLASSRKASLRRSTCNHQHKVLSMLGCVMATCCWTASAGAK